jgi:hypothetical protein
LYVVLVNSDAACRIRLVHGLPGRHSGSTQRGAGQVYRTGLRSAVDAAEGLKPTCKPKHLDNYSEDFVATMRAKTPFEVIPGISISGQKPPQRQRRSRTEPTGTVPNQSLFESLKARQSRPECEEIRQTVSQRQGLKKAAQSDLFVI